MYTLDFSEERQHLSIFTRTLRKIEFPRTRALVLSRFQIGIIYYRCGERERFTVKYKYYIQYISIVCVCLKFHGEIHISMCFGAKKANADAYLVPRIRRY